MLDPVCALKLGNKATGGQQNKVYFTEIKWVPLHEVGPVFFIYFHTHTLLFHGKDAD